MTIRRALLLTLILFSVSFAALMTVLSYSRARAALSDEIRTNLEIQAFDVMQRIDAMLFERIKDVQGWRGVDVMQEVRVGDVDKRLARFLHDIKTAYAGVYTDLHCAQSGTIVASSDAAVIGDHTRPPETWLEVAMPDGPIAIARPQRLGTREVMLLHSELRDAYSNEPLGMLVAGFDWGEVRKLLEQTARESGRGAALLDAEGRLLAAAGDLEIDAGALLEVSRRVVVRDHGVVPVGREAASPSQLLLGFAHSTAYRGLPDLGWSLLVVTPQRVAFTPVRRLLWTLLVLLAVTALVAAGLAVRISAQIARPLQELTRYAREIGRDIDVPVRAIGGTSEIHELSRSFNDMVEDLRRSRAHLVRVAKLAAVGEMASMLAHEVRTPLGIIRSSAQLVDRQGNLDVEAREMLGFMINECDRINGLVTGLLEAARPRQPDFHPHDLNGIIRHVLDMLQARLAESEVGAELVAAADLPEISCDRNQMVQVLLNVLLNAIQAVDRGGRVRITSARCARGVEIRVEDDGPGIAPERREAVMEPFVSYRAGGIGLGLSVVREIVELHGGTIAFEDGSMGGACVVVTLPVEEG